MSAIRTYVSEAGVKVERGSEVFKIPVETLRLFDSNQRLLYGFASDKEDEIMQIIRENYITGSFTQEQKDLILNNLIDFSALDNPQLFMDSMQWLINSICTEGLIDPIRGYWDANTNEFTATDGNRRTVALIIANQLLGKGIKLVKVLSEEEKPTSATAQTSYLRRQLISNNGGRAYNKVELARTLKQLEKLGQVTQDELITLAGSKQILDLCFKLLETSVTVQEAVAKGDIAPTTAVQVVEEAIQNGLTHDEVSEAVQEAVEEVKEARSQKRTNAKKASKANIQSKVKAVAERNGKEIKKDDPAKVESLKKNIQYMLEKGALDSCSQDSLEEICKALGKNFQD